MAVAASGVRELRTIQSYMVCTKIDLMQLNSVHETDGSLRPTYRLRMALYSTTEIIAMAIYTYKLG